MQFKTKNVVIVGASRGLGKILAEKFSKEGARVILMSRTEADLKTNVDLINAAGGQASYYTLDITDTDSVNSAFAQLFETIDFIDILINCAGVMKDFCFSNATYDDFQQLNDVNVNGVMRVIFAAMAKFGRPLSKDPTHHEGLAIIISSMASYLIPSNMEFYAITKYTVRGIANALRKHYQVSEEPKMKVLVVCPAQFDTELWSTPKMKEWAQKMKSKGMLPSADFIATKIIKAAHNEQRELVVGNMAYLGRAGVHFIPEITDKVERSFLN